MSLYHSLWGLDFWRLVQRKVSFQLSFFTRCLYLTRGAFTGLSNTENVTELRRTGAAKGHTLCFELRGAVPCCLLPDKDPLTPVRFQQSSLPLQNYRRASGRKTSTKLAARGLGSLPCITPGRVSPHQPPEMFPATAAPVSSPALSHTGPSSLRPPLSSAADFCSVSYSCPPSLKEATSRV